MTRTPKTPWFRRKRGTKVSRQVALGLLEDAQGRVQPPPVHIHNPDGGTRSHDLDPDTGRPVCKASGAAWVTGDGGLRLCGLCRDMRAGRLGGTGEAAASLCAGSPGKAGLPPRCASRGRR